MHDDASVNLRCAEEPHILLYVRTDIESKVRSAVKTLDRVHQVGPSTPTPTPTSPVVALSFGVIGEGPQWALAERIVAALEGMGLQTRRFVSYGIVKVEISEPYTSNACQAIATTGNTAPSTTP